MNTLTADFLNTSHSLIVKTILRGRLLGELCPTFAYSEADDFRKATLKQLAETNRDISRLCDKLRAIERRGKGVIGLPALGCRDLPNPLRVAVSILAGKMLSHSLSFEARNLAQLAQTAAADIPRDLLLVRDAFRPDGVLRPYVVFRFGRSLDEFSEISLTERAFLSYLHQPKNEEVESMLALRDRR